MATAARWRLAIFGATTCAVRAISSHVAQLPACSNTAITYRAATLHACSSDGRRLDSYTIAAPVGSRRGSPEARLRPVDGRSKIQPSSPRLPARTTSRPKPMFSFLAERQSLSSHSSKDHASRAGTPQVAAWSQMNVVDEKAVLVAINALFVTLLVFWVTYSILNVDAEISRGWSILEKYARLLSANWDAYEANLREMPVLTKTAINTGIYLLADYLSQLLSGVKPLEFDLRRVLRNGAIGAFFGPIVCAYYSFSDAILPPLDTANVPYKILMDQTIYCATKYSMYLSLVGLSAGKSLAECAEEVKTKLWPTLTTGWRFWPAVHLVTYNFIPPRHRVLWINCVDIVWVTVLATIAGNSKGAQDGNGGKQATGDISRQMDRSAGAKGGDGAKVGGGGVCAIADDGRGERARPAHSVRRALVLKEKVSQRRGAVAARDRRSISHTWLAPASQAHSRRR